MRSSVFAFFFLMLCCGSYAQLDTSALDKLIAQTQQDFNLPSMSVAIVKEGKTIYSMGVGAKSEANQDAPNENTLYAVASLSKAFTAASIAMLVEDGKLNWDDPVTKHLPWFKLNDPYVTNHITIEDLLCHRSGLITFDGDLLWYGSNYTRREAIERLQYRPLTHGFRDKFGYQNLMFMTAGEVIEAASGMTWDDFVKARILDPIGMNRTTSNFDVFANDENIAKPHIEGTEIFMLSYDNSGATAALNSSAKDMAKWMNFWLADGIVHGDTLLTKASINRIWSLHTPLNTSNFDNQHGTNFKGYGLGWFLMDYNGDKIAHHGGGLPGYITKVALSESDDFGIVVLTNDMSSAPTMMMYAALDWLHGRPIDEWSETFLEFKEKSAERTEKEKRERLASKNANAKSLPKSDYVGTYEDQMYGEAEVIINGTDLVLVLKPAKELFSGKLSLWDDHAFRFDHNDPFLTYGVIEFDVEKDKVQGFTIDLPNYDFHFNKLNFVRK